MGWNCSTKDKQMRFIIAGRTYSIGSLDTALDQAFVDLHAAYFSNQPLHWEKFKEKALAFFDQNYGNFKATEIFFQNFTIIWKQFLNNGLWDQAENIWELALEAAIEWEEKNKGKRIHKGGPYYFWGMTAIQRGDIDRGYALMHQALEEDVLTHNKKNPDTPSLAFASLNYLKVDQAFRQWVLLEAQYLGEQIKNYCTNYGRTFTLEDFQRNYLQVPPSGDVIYLLAYAIARLIRLISLPEYLLSSPFAGQLLQNLLFDLVQVVDVTIAEKNKPKWKMMDHINFLSRKASQGISISKLKEANSQLQLDFEKTVGEIINGSFKFKDGTILSPLQADLLISYGLRNRGAHDLSSSSIIWKKFNRIQAAVFSTLFLAVELLY
jgi:hypothetical protein